MREDLMRKLERACKIRDILDKIYPSPVVPLKYHDTYTLLIASLLSARCTDVRVNRITPQLFARADNPHDMVQLSVSEIENIIRPCGLSSHKANAIWHLSQELLQKYSSRVPNTFEDLEALPGIGHKTASVVMAQGFGHAAFPVDTHIHRCAKRWGLSQGKTVMQTEHDMKKLFPKKSWHKLHLQIVYFGREYCRARGHMKDQCPICSWAMEDD